jgi:MFS family permease
MSAMFRSLSGFNYRVWAAGAIVSNVGTWMQRTAQDWIVLTQLTHHDAAAVGFVMALQFGPQLLLLPLSGLVADRFDQRKVLMATQAVMGLLGLALGILTVTGTVQLWHVYVFALLLGCVAAFDAPARQTFVAQLVGGANLSNAVALNSASFSAARMIGPAVAGLLTAAVGAGWVFLINAGSFGAVLLSLAFLRLDELQRQPSATAKKGNLAEGFRYVRSRPDIMVILVMVFLIGTFGLNFPIFISTMATTVFHKGAAEFGVLSSVMAVGSVIGALLSARREKPRLRFLFAASAVFGIGAATAALAPDYWGFAVALAVVGLASQTMMTTANGAVQLSTPAPVRGRVMAIFLAIFMGGTPLGAPIVGWVANEFGPRWALGVGAASGFAAALIGLLWLVKYRHLRVRYGQRRLRLTHDGRARAVQEIVTTEVPAQRDGRQRA